jgi:hypothetical protein
MPDLAAITAFLHDITLVNMLPLTLPMLAIDFSTSSPTANLKNQQLIQTMTTEPTTTTKTV